MSKIGKSYDYLMTKLYSFIGKNYIVKYIKHYFETGALAGIQPSHEVKLRRRLEMINRARDVRELNLQSFRLHQLKGDRAGIWSVVVTGNWRITFKFENGDAYILNYEDYH